MRPARLATSLAALLAIAGGAAGQDWSFCADAPDGGGLVEPDPWGLRSGVWLVQDWLYHPAHTHDRALRVDGFFRWSTLGGDCTRFPSATFDATAPGGPGHATWTTPMGQVTETLSETREGGCCGLLVEISITNTDSVQHFYEWRTYHDTAFGDASPSGPCIALTPVVDGGPVQIAGVTYQDELDLLALGGGTCPGQLRMFSGETLALHSSWQMLDPHLPTDMEYIRWNEGAEPCTTWRGLVDAPLEECADNSLLLIWRFPEGNAWLAPGQSDTASYRIGWKCAWPCAGCQQPLLDGGAARDDDPCRLGILLGWSAASFPGSGAGAYHVYRSTTSFADALAAPPLATDVGATSWIDAATSSGETYYYVVQAEALDMPGCGAGPLVGGSTDELELGPVTDVADLVGPVSIVGDALRATGHTDDTVDFNWLLAAPPGPGETYVVLRSDDDPENGFVAYATTLGRTWTDPLAPPRFAPAHVWFYDVRYADECGNVSLD